MFKRKMPIQIKNSWSSDLSFDAKLKCATVQATSINEAKFMEEVEIFLPIKLKRAIRNEYQAWNSNVIADISDHKQHNLGLFHRNTSWKYIAS